MNKIIKEKNKYYLKREKIINKTNSNIMVLTR